MKSEEFWDQENVKIRFAVRTFIENYEKTCGWSDAEQYEFEEELMRFIESVKDDVYIEREKEYRREDILIHAENDKDERCKEIAMLIPIRKLNAIIELWDDTLDDSDRYWESYWDALSLNLRRESWWRDFIDYTEEEFSWYKAYIEYWYSTHQEGDPVSIEEFLNNEMRDEDLAIFYKELAEKQKTN